MIHFYYCGLVVYVLLLFVGPFFVLWSLLAASSIYPNDTVLFLRLGVRVLFLDTAYDVNSCVCGRHVFSGIQTHSCIVLAVGNGTLLEAYFHCLSFTLTFQNRGSYQIQGHVNSRKYWNRKNAIENCVVLITYYYSLESVCAADRNQSKLENFCGTGNLFVARRGVEFHYDERKEIIITLPTL